MIPPKLSTEYIKSPINYNGNKYKQLSKIVPLFPKGINEFVDVFGGSGTVMFNAEAKSYTYNDINPYVSSIVMGILTESFDSILTGVRSLEKEYSLSMTNKEGFEKLRLDYNNGRKDWLTLYVLMCYSFNHQFRFNAKHEYNSSFGFNRSYFSERQEQDLQALKKKNLLNVSVSCSSFTDFFEHTRFGERDFIYLDPPYFGSTGNYNDGKRGFDGWTAEHEKSLWALCDYLTDNQISFAMSNNLKYDNPYLQDCLYKYNVHHIDSTGYSNYHMKDTSKGDEILITNY